jgi:excisionase family DNA binding protein
MAEKLLTIAEAGALLGTKSVTTYRMVWSGILRAVDISRPGTSRPSFRIPESAITALIESRQVRA